jgi:hypothetical protein
VSQRLLALTCALTLVLTLAACGKAGSPTVPGSAFPLPYPNPKLSPTQTAEPTATADQPGMQADNKAKFTDKGSYIDPSVKDTELRRGAVGAGATLPYTQTTQPGSNTPFNQSSGIQGASPLGSATGTPPQDDEQPPP